MGTGAISRFQLRCSTTNHCPSLTSMTTQPQATSTLRSQGLNILIRTRAQQRARPWNMCGTTSLSHLEVPEKDLLGFSSSLQTGRAKRPRVWWLSLHAHFETKEWVSLHLASRVTWT